MQLLQALLWILLALQTRLASRAIAFLKGCSQERCGGTPRQVDRSKGTHSPSLGKSCARCSFSQHGHVILYYVVCCWQRHLDSVYIHTSVSVFLHRLRRFHTSRVISSSSSLTLTSGRLSSICCGSLAPFVAC